MAPHYTLALAWKQAHIPEKKKKKRTVSSFDTRFVTAATAAAAVHKEHYMLITGLRFRDILTRLSFLSDSGGEA